MLNDPKGDALHLALACYYKVDVLLTWNCQHIANANKFDHIRRINFQIGLPTPILATPLNYLDEKKTMIHSELVEIRKIRHKISEKYDNDLNQLLDHYKILETKLKASGKYKFIQSKTTYKHII